MNEGQTRPGQGSRPLAGRLRSHVLAIAAGEGLARLCNLLLVVFLSRTFGVRAAGAYAVAQALALYQMNGTDFGLRQTGARLIARNPGNFRQVVRFIQRRRILLALVVITIGYWYGRAGPVPADARPLVSLCALALFGYSLSVDWLAWGMQRFVLMSGWRALVSVIAVTVTIVGVVAFHLGLLIVPLGIALGYLLAGFWLWVFWARKVVAVESEQSRATPLLELPDWKSTAMLGVALLMYQAFYSIDTVMLAGMTDSAQTGLYSAAYRVLLLVLAIYYFIMQAIYPRLAAIPEGQQRIHMLKRPLFLALAAGTGTAIIMAIVRKPLIELLFGDAFKASVGLAGPLLFAIPLDFVTSVLLTVLVAWDHPRRVIAATGTAVATNVLLNVFLIPRYGASGAAYATPLSYIPFLLTLIWQIYNVSKDHASREHTQSDDAVSAIAPTLIS